MTTITIPEFNFSAFYYAELLEALLQYKRIYVPELTDELPHEPFIQFLRAVALMGHLNNTTIDLVANESYLPTAKLADSVRQMLRLIGYELQPASPSQADVVYELSKVFTTSFELVNEDAQASIAKEGTNPIIYFEALESLTINRTDQLDAVFAVEDDVFTDYTTEANSDTTPADDWTPWSTPVSGDSIYFGHENIMWDRLSVYLTTASENIEGVFEFYDGDWLKTAPTSVTNLGGGYLEIDLTSLLGSQNRQNTDVRVQYNESGAYENVLSTWTGTKNIATTGLLGQTSPSTTATDYTIGSDWSILDVDDGTSDFTVDGDVDFDLPQTLTQNWIQTTVNSVEAFWLRYRIITVSTPLSPTIINTRIDERKQYATRLVTQGRTHTDNPLGSSSGLADQEFDTSQEHFISESETITIDDEEWTRVDNFLSSKSNDKHYRVVLTTNDKATIIFGNGINGKIPPIGVGNIVAVYRYGGDNDGNVGANTITVDKTGLTYVNKLWNPRGATGWSEAQGASESSLEQAKIIGPASLRTKEVAISVTDVENITIAYTNDAGTKPFSRASAFEEGYGPKTIELVLVARGGGTASAEQIEGLELYFNGDKYVYPPVEAHLISNQQVVGVNYTSKSIDLDITVYGSVTEAQITNALQGIIQPEALKEDGVTWEWEFGAEVSLSRIIHEVFDIDTSITKVIINSPASDITLQSRELPILGTLTLTIIEP